MRSSRIATIVGLGLMLTALSWGQAPFELRTYVDTSWDPGELAAPAGFTPLSNFYPVPNAAAPAATTESTIKGPYTCPYCGYSATVGGTCPDPWQVNNHPNNVALLVTPLAERFFHFSWMASPLGQLYAVARGMPFRPGDPHRRVAGTEASNQQSRVRAALGWVNQPGPGNRFANNTQVRFLLIPPSLARPTARYSDLDWGDPGITPPGVDGPFGDDTWISAGGLRVGVHPLRAVDRDWYQVRIRAQINLNNLNGDGDFDDYDIGAARWERQFNDLWVQVWSDANGIEMDRHFSTAAQVDAQVGAAPRMMDLVCESGAVRLTLPLAQLRASNEATNQPPAGGPYDLTLWWTLGFRICNAARALPGVGDGPPATFPAGEPIQWLPCRWVTPTPPRRPDLPSTWTQFRTQYNSPQNYYEVGAGGTVIADADGTGNGGTGPVLTDETAEQFRLRPGEAGTGTVAVLWRAPGGATPNMWSYDQAVANEGQADAFDQPGGAYTPTHNAGIQMIAAHFFCSRVEVPRPQPALLAGESPTLVRLTTPAVALPAGTPGGQTSVGYTEQDAGGTRVVQLGVASREVAGHPLVAGAQRESITIVRCPPYVSTTLGRDNPAAPATFIDPYAGGNAGYKTGRGPGGDPDQDYLNAAANPARTIGCGAAHRIWFVHSIPGDPTSRLTTAPCWCGRRYLDSVTGQWVEGHNPAVPESMRCGYCGTVLRESECVRPGAALPNVPPTNLVPHDTVDGEALIDVAPGTDSAGRSRVSLGVMAGEAARRPQALVVGPQGRPTPWLTGESPAGTLPAGTSSAFTAVAAPLFADLPEFQLFSFPPVAGREFENDRTAPGPYQGGFVAYRAEDPKNAWFTDLAGTHHYPDPQVDAAGGDPAKRLFDRNGKWDIYYQCPDCGNKLEINAVGQPCNHGLCPGHQDCPRCGAVWEAKGEGQGTDVPQMVLSHCPFCPDHPLLTTVAPNTIAPADLTAEEFDPVCVWTHVVRKTRLGAQQQTVDLGRTAPGVDEAGGNAYPSRVSPAVIGPTDNQGNYPVAAARSQGAAAGATAGNNVLTVTTSASESMSLTRDDVTVDSETHSPVRLARSMPLTAERLAAAGADSSGGWGTTFPSGYRGSAGPQATMALLQAGTAEGPVPTGIGSGSYAGGVLAYVDTSGNGALDFLDRSQNLAAVNSSTTVFDPAEDVALEPVVALNTRLRVIESPLPYCDPAASDVSAMPLFLSRNPGNGLHSALEVLWESNHIAGGGTPNPDAPFNLYEAQAGTAAGPGIARDYNWPNPPPQPAAVTTDTAARAVNGSPEAYLDTVSNQKWAFWHNISSAPTDLGAVSQMWQSHNTPDLASPFTVAANTGVVSDAELSQGFVRGFVNTGAAAPANHWSFWHAGKRGQERVYYCADYDPANKRAEDRVLPLANRVEPSVKNDWVPVTVTVNGTTTTVTVRKPGKSPFTYAKEPAPVLEVDPVTGDPQVHVCFTGFVPQDRNSDICYVRFDLAGLTAADAARRNYGKVPLPRVEGAVPLWGGEELRPDDVRQSFGARHLDWLTSRVPDGVTADVTHPDFIAAPSAGAEPQLRDPAIFVHLVSAGTPPANHTVRAVTWSPGSSRYDRAKGIYRLGGLQFGGGAPPAPRGGRELEMELDPAAGVVRFTAPLFNPQNPADDTAVYNTTNTPGLVDVQVWASYTPYTYRICRDDANDDSPSAFYDYGGPGLAMPAGMTAAQRASLGRLVVFWRRAEGSSDPLYFGRTAFMYASLTDAVQVGHPPVQGQVTVTDITVGGAVTPLGLAADDGFVGLPPMPSPSGHTVRVQYTTRGGAQHTEYHVVPGLGAEQRANVDTVMSEGPLVVRREWYNIPSLRVGGETSTPYLARYWLFWTSPRVWYSLGARDFRQSTDVYYATVVPESGTTEPVSGVPSR